MGLPAGSHSAPLDHLLDLGGAGGLLLREVREGKRGKEEGMGRKGRGRGNGKWGREGRRRGKFTPWLLGPGDGRPWSSVTFANFIFSKKAVLSQGTSRCC